MKKILNIVLFIILLMFFYSGCDSGKKRLQEKKTETTQKTEPVQLKKSEYKPIKKTEKVTNKKYLQGMTAADLHGNLTNRSFKLEKKLSGDFNYWRCTQKTSTYEYEATAYGDGPWKIYKVEAVVLNFSVQSNKKVGRDFLAYIASIPYDGSEPRKANEWVKANVGKATSIVIGNAKFELFVNDLSIILEITPL